ncbi:MAG: ribose 5-phosphate isomerase B [Candidatus Margulisiibacteriota bacterium]
MPTRIAIGSDHGGYELKNALASHLKKIGVEVLDLGTMNAEGSVDYPDFAVKVAEYVNKDADNKGILICGTGIGMSIAANKIKGIRAALCHDEYTAEMAKRHNNANILVLGGRVLNAVQGAAIVDKWLGSEFDGDRHARRLEKIKAIEESQNN